MRALPGALLLTVFACGSHGNGPFTELPVLTTGGGYIAATPEGPFYYLGTTVELTAVPDEGSSFDGWLGSCQGTGTCTVEVWEGTVVTASFSPPSTSWAVMFAQGSYSHGSVVTSAAPGYVAAGVTTSAQARAGGEAVDAGPPLVSGDLMFVAGYDDSGAEQWRVVSETVGDFTVASPLGGNVLVGGYFAGTLRLGALEASANGAFAGFLAELTAGGDVVDFELFDGAGNDRVLGLVVGSGLELTVVGSFTEELSIGSSNLSEVRRDIFLARRNSLSEWSADSFGSIGEDDALSVAETSDGKTWVLVNLDNATNLDSLDAGPGLTLIQVDGLTASAIETMPGSRVDKGGLQALPGGALAVLATFSDGIVVGGESLTSSGDTDWFLAARLADGSYPWLKHGGGPGPDVGAGLALSGDRVYMGGTFAGTAGFGASQTVTAHAYGDCDLCPDGFVAAYDLDSGALSWVRRLGGWGMDAIRSVAAAGDGAVATGAAHGGPVDLGTGPLTNSSGVLLRLRE